MEGDRLGVANSRRGLGNLHLKAQHHKDALRNFIQAADLYQVQQEPFGTAYTQAQIARCHQASGNEQARDLALSAALRAAQASGVDRVMQYVVAALEEVTGGKAQAQAWLAAHSL